MNEHMNIAYGKNKLYYFSLALIIIVGLWIRLKGLGKWPLAVDEYYIVKSMENIIKYGLPQFDAGGYYDRGILYQYLTSFLFLIGFETEFAARLIPVLSNLLVIPPLYLLSKKISGPIVALLVTFFLTFSLWEIEFARFARMYAPFQAIFVWYIYFLYKVIVEKNDKSWKWLFVFSLLGILVYEGSVFILVLNFLPFLVHIKIKIKEFTFSSILIILTYFYIRVDFRNMGSSDLLPQIAKDYHFSLPRSGGLIKIPNMLVSFAFEDLWLGMIFILVLGLTAWSIFLIYREISKNKYQGFLIAIIFLLTLLNQFGLAIIFMILSLLFNWIDIRNINRKIILVFIFTFILHLLYWLIFAMINNSWYSFFPGFEPLSTIQILKRIFVLFINYPSTYSAFWMYYVTLPNFTFIISLFLLIGLVLTLRKKSSRNTSHRFLYLVITLSFLVVTYLVPGIETRYTFFLYPIVLLLLVSSIKSLSMLIFSKKSPQYILLGFSLITVFYFSEDYDLMHAINVDSAKYNFRTEYNDRLQRHYYRRYDVRTPGEYVNNNIKVNDIVLINEMVLEYYLQEIDYIFIDYQSRRFPILSTHHGEKERWTNANLIYSKDSLLQFLSNNTQDIWFVVHKLPYIQQPLIEIGFYKKFEKFRVYQSIDEMVNVYYIPRFHN